MLAIQERGLDALIRRFERPTDRVMTALGQTLGNELQTTVNYIRANKLSGQVLQRRTGKLSDSLNSSVTISGFQVLGQVFTQGVKYAAIHEYGGIINHPGGTAYMMIFGQLRFVSNANPLSALMPRTKAHQIPMPERSYVRTGISDRITDIKRSLGDATKKALLA